MSNPTSFLPEDYVKQKHATRTNLISLVLFAVVMVGTMTAFMWTNQRWRDVNKEEAQINQQVREAASMIEDYRTLEAQKTEMLERAALAAALVERVPRSILLAELINRMPANLSITSFELTSEEIKKVTRPDRATTKNGRLAPGKKRGKTLENAVTEGKKRVAPPEYRVDIELIGLAPTDLEVSRYMAELNAYALLNDVELDYSEETEYNEKTMREFKVRMWLSPDADMRDSLPLQNDRDVTDPTNDTMQIGAFTGDDS